MDFGAELRGILEQSKVNTNEVDTTWNRLKHLMKLEAKKQADHLEWNTYSIEDRGLVKLVLNRAANEGLEAEKKGSLVIFRW